MNTVNATTLLTEGSKNFKENFWKLLLIHLIIIIFIIGLIVLSAMFLSLSFRGSFTGGDLPIGGIILLTIIILALLLILPVIVAGYQYIYVKLIHKEKAAFGDIFSGFSNFWSIWLAQYFKGVLIFSGTILFMIPVFIAVFFTVGIDFINTPAWMMNTAYGFQSYFSSTSFLILFIVIYILFFISSIYWTLKFLFVPLAAIDKDFLPGEAVYYGSKITNGYKKNIFLALLIPMLISFVLGFLNAFFDKNVILNIVVMLLNLFIITPWIYSIIGSTYVRLSTNFNNNPPSSLLKIIEPQEHTDEEKNEPFGIEDNLTSRINENIGDRLKNVGEDIDIEKDLNDETTEEQKKVDSEEQNNEENEL